jgi:hypothetical protein
MGGVMRSTENDCPIETATSRLRKCVSAHNSVLRCIERGRSECKLPTRFELCVCTCLSTPCKYPVTPPFSATGKPGAIVD